MALSPAFVDAHIARWEAALNLPYYPHRKSWPSLLFHHAPLDNAVRILTEGFLRSRNDPANSRPSDVAGEGVIDTREDAHDWVRMYFRPKTPTQFNIEGIRQVGECAFGENAHAPILVMFGLDAKSVLTQQDVIFSDRNMQLSSAITGNSPEHFSSIPFEKVYHEGSYQDSTIKQHRCAEVLAPSPLDLSTTLSAVYFRSEPERDTLLNMLPEQGARWRTRCHVSSGLKVFQKRHTFVQEIGLTPAGVVFAMNTREDRKNISIRITVHDMNGQCLINFIHSSHAAKPTSADRWIYERSLENGLYNVEVFLEDHLAFRGPILLGESLF
jgi:hypothetical protein